MSMTDRGMSSETLAILETPLRMVAFRTIDIRNDEVKYWLTVRGMDGNRIMAERSIPCAQATDRYRFIDLAVKALDELREELSARSADMGSPILNREIHFVGEWNP